MLKFIDSKPCPSLAYQDNIVKINGFAITASTRGIQQMILEEWQEQQKQIFVAKPNQQQENTEKTINYSYLHQDLNRIFRSKCMINYQLALSQSKDSLLDNFIRLIDGDSLLFFIPHDTNLHKKQLHLLEPIVKKLEQKLNNPIAVSQSLAVPEQKPETLKAIKQTLQQFNSGFLSLLLEMSRYIQSPLIALYYAIQLTKHTEPLCPNVEASNQNLRANLGQDYKQTKQYQAWPDLIRHIYDASFLERHEQIANYKIDTVEVEQYNKNWCRIMDIIMITDSLNSNRQL